MKKPEMILFDYGGTLIYEPDFTPQRGNEAIFPYICENPHNVTVEEFGAYLLQLFDDIRRLRGEYIEIHEHPFLRYVLEYFDMKLSIPMDEAERIVMNGISKGVMTPKADKMLKKVRDSGIRTGVISNLCWSGNALKQRLSEFFPDHDLEFVITSSEYIFRKPDPHIFEMAVRKSGLSAEDIWYCGNYIRMDVCGAHDAGMFPVWYDDRSIPSRFHELNDGVNIDFPHIHLGKWDELEKYL